MDESMSISLFEEGENITDGYNHYSMVIAITYRQKLLLKGWQGEGAGERRVVNHPSMGNPDPQADILYIKSTYLFYYRKTYALICN
jgi:hypothetical protein